MALTVPNVGKKVWLDNFIAAGALYLHLYKNSVTITRSTVFGDMTAPTFAGYAVKTTSGWAAASIDANNKATSSAAQETWTATGGPVESIFGYALTGSASGGAVYAIEAFASGSVPMGTNGDVLKITPNLTVKSEVNN